MSDTTQPTHLDDAAGPLDDATVSRETLDASDVGDVGEVGEVDTDGTDHAERLEQEGDVAADYLEKLLDLADLDGDIEVDIDGDRASVAVVDSEEGRVPRRLVGRDGEVLEALQELTRLAVLAQTGQRSRLMLDVAGHRAGRRTALVARAKEAVAQVRESGERLALEPMSPFERKVVHDAVAEAGLVTESEGVEPQRHVVVLPV
jgi:spoIIIJ-associated protein